MYVFPKGLQSLYELSVTAGSVPKLPSIDVVATMASFSVIMGLIQKGNSILLPCRSNKQLEILHQ